jgi:retron-type reverse transcriptase
MNLASEIFALGYRVTNKIINWTIPTSIDLILSSAVRSVLHRTIHDDISWEVSNSIGWTIISTFEADT